LTLLVGQTLPADLPPPSDFDDAVLLADIPAGLPSDLLLRRPDVSVQPSHLFSGFRTA